LNAIEHQFNEGIAALLDQETIGLLLVRIWPLVRGTEGGQALLHRKHNT
jgi:hypothetical protein